MVIEPQGWEVEVPPGVTLLMAARTSGVVLPSSCRNGTCRACLCQLDSGQVTYLVEWPGLSAEEKQEGCILPCVALAASPLTVRAPGARRDGGAP